jgi:hypothetical protein
MEDRIFAIINNLDGLTTQERVTLKNMGCEVGTVYNVKDVVFNGDNYDVTLDLFGIEVSLGGENLTLYKTYDGNDIIRYTPEKPSQKGEE